MTVVNPKSISGINSITMASGSDNLLTIHTTNTTERVRVNSDGDVIVGSGITVSPDGDIFTTGVTTATTFVGALTGTASANAVLTGSTNNTVTTVTGANAIQGESALTFDGNTLTVSAPSNDTPFVVDTASTNGAHLRFQKDGSNQHFVGAGAGMGVGDKEDLSLRAYDNILFASGNSSTERLRITSAGDVGINSTAPSTKLDVVDDSASGYIAKFRQSNTSNSGQIVIDSPTDSDSRPVLMDMTRAGTIQWSIGQGYNSSGGAFHLATSSLSAGVTGVKASFLAGGGLTFNGDTAAANALDDYEEGTCPNLAFKAGNAPANSNTSIQESRYIKIGSLVYITFFIDMNAHNAETGGSAFITGLPFTAANRHSSISIGYFNSLIQNQTILGGTIQPGSQQILLRHATSAATATASMDYSNAIGTSTEMIISATYSIV